MDVETLRSALHDAVDQTIAKYLASVPPGPGPGPGSHSLQIALVGDHPPFDHRFPKDWMEAYTTARRYSLIDRGKSREVVIGWAERDAWGRLKGDRIRKRATVFGLNARGSRYPWVEFVESENDRYSAALPADPARRRNQLKDGDPVPDRFKAATLERTDVLFAPYVDDGPAMRLVLRSDDEPGMIEFGYWLAGERKKL